MYKVIQRDRDTGRQVKKRIYETTKSFNIHAFDTCSRYVNYYKVEIYKQVNEEWVLINSFQDREEFHKMIDVFTKSPRETTYLEILSKL